MSQQAKYAVAGLVITITLLVLLINLDNTSDGVTASMWVIISLIFVSAFFTFVQSANAVNVPKLKKMEWVVKESSSKPDER